VIDDTGEDVKLIIGVSGASGAVYGIRLLEVLSAVDSVETHLTVTQNAVGIMEFETGRKLEEVQELADKYYHIEDMNAPIASGSFVTDGMIIAPCSVKSLSAVANSYADNLLTRAADVVLKENRKLVLAVRETPLHLGHLENMTKAARLGAVVLPPIPAFYHKPVDINDIVDHSVGKMLDMFGIEHRLFKRWGQM
jgi:4-hydroxy-3-polyprenylbenzoate decarboxylase